MKPDATPRGGRPGAYLPVFDGRKQRVRGLWQRRGQYVARLTTETPDGSKKLIWHVLEGASTVAQAREAMAALSVKRKEGELVARKEAPSFATFVGRYLTEEAAKKSLATRRKETTHLGWWRNRFGSLRLDKVRKAHVAEGLIDLERGGMAARTRNLYLISLRNLFGHARTMELVAQSPADGFSWSKAVTKKRQLVSRDDFERLIDAASAPLFFKGRIALPGEPAARLRNAQEFGDYLRFLLFTGAREKEALRVRWDDVDFERKQVVIGADGAAKNREWRPVDFNPALESHLRSMAERRAPDSRWLFPSPQRGEKDVPAQTFRESLKLARKAAGLDSLGFHDTRHAFISQAVMAGVDFMTIARWVGHKDGGVLIGKVYGHVANEHRQRMAARLDFVAGGQKEIEPTRFAA
ncbi:MAG: site-specific integrase [Verrucomicrobiales bacterium]|nr:site-specific integrase [Verrucomicrobiales bacterium]